MEVDNRPKTEMLHFERSSDKSIEFLFVVNDKGTPFLGAWRQDSKGKTSLVAGQRVSWTTVGRFPRMRSGDKVVTKDANWKKWLRVLSGR